MSNNISVESVLLADSIAELKTRVCDLKEREILEWSVKNPNLLKSVLNSVIQVNLNLKYMK